MTILRESPWYQEIQKEGELKGFQAGEQTGAFKEVQSFVLRLLARRIGNVSPLTKAQIQALSLTQLESLGEALLDFSQPDDLQNWLRTLGAEQSHS